MNSLQYNLIYNKEQITTYNNIDIDLALSFNNLTYTLIAENNKKYLNSNSLLLNIEDTDTIYNIFKHNNDQYSYQLNNILFVDNNKDMHILTYNPSSLNNMTLKNNVMSFNVIDNSNNIFMHTYQTIFAYNSNNYSYIYSNENNLKNISSLHLGLYKYDNDNIILNDNKLSINVDKFHYEPKYINKFVTQTNNILNNYSYNVELFYLTKKYKDCVHTSNLSCKYANDVIITDVNRSYHQQLQDDIILKNTNYVIIDIPIQYTYKSIINKNLDFHRILCPIKIDKFKINFSKNTDYLSINYNKSFIYDNKCLSIQKNNDVIICLVSYDAIGWDDELIQLLKEFGMGESSIITNAPNKYGRYPFLFIGSKDLGEGNGFTLMNNKGNWDNPVELYASLTALGEVKQIINLKGTAYDYEEGHNSNVQPCEITINGGENIVNTPYKRGLNFVAIDKQTFKIIEQANYDTYGEAVNSPYKFNAGITLLKAKLRSINNNDVIICLVSYDAIGWDGTEQNSLISLLQGFGMGDLPYTETGRYPFLFVGYKNLGKGNGITVINDQGSSLNTARVSVSISKTGGQIYPVNDTEFNIKKYRIYLKGTARDNNQEITTTLPCEVKINNGNNLIVNLYKRGINFVAIDKKTHQIIHVANYDTYGESAEPNKNINGITELKNTLNAIKNGESPCDTNMYVNDSCRASLYIDIDNKIYNDVYNTKQYNETFLMNIDYDDNDINNYLSQLEINFKVDVMHNQFKKLYHNYNYGFNFDEHGECIGILMLKKSPRIIDSTGKINYYDANINNIVIDNSIINLFNSNGFSEQIIDIINKDIFVNYNSSSIDNIFIQTDNLNIQNVLNNGFISHNDIVYYSDANIYKRSNIEYSLLKFPNKLLYRDLNYLYDNDDTLSINKYDHSQNLFLTNIFIDNTYGCIKTCRYNDNVINNHYSRYNDNVINNHYKMNKSNHNNVFDKIYKYRKSGLLYGDFYTPCLQDYLMMYLFSIEKYFDSDIYNKLNTFINNTPKRFLTNQFRRDLNTYKIEQYIINTDFNNINLQTYDNDDINTNNYIWPLFTIPDYSIINSDNYIIMFSENENCEYIDYYINTTENITININYRSYTDNIGQFIIFDENFKKLNNIQISETKLIDTNNNIYQMSLYVGFVKKLTLFYICYKDSEDYMNNIIISNQKYRILSKVYLKNEGI